MSSPMTFQDIILALSRYWADQGCVVLQPYDIEVGAGTFHPATDAARARARTVAHRVRAAVAPADRRPLRREPEPPAALLPVPGHPQAEPRRRARPLLRLAARDRHRARRARRAPRRGRLGVADARRVGPGLGGLAQRHGGARSSPTSSRSAASSAVPCPPRSPTASSGSRCTSRASTASTTSRGRSARRTTFTYGDVFLRNEQQYSAYNFEVADVDDAARAVRARTRASAGARSRPGYVLPAYDYVLKCSHAFNLLDARGAISGDRAPGLHPARARARQGVLRGVSDLIAAPAEEPAPKARSLLGRR